MGFNLTSLIAQRRSEQYLLYQHYLDRYKAKSSARLGFARRYTHAQGCRILDADGLEYLDFDAGNGVFAIGRNHPDVSAAIAALISDGTPNWVGRDIPLLPGLLAEALARHTPAGLDKFLFTTTGSETTEAALKFARRATSRARFLYLEGAFHGLSYGALSVTDTGSRLQLMGAGFAPMLPACTQIPREDDGALECELEKGDVAALIVEPIQGAAVTELSQRYLRRARALCDKYRAVLIVDEILTGMGRTGDFFACQHAGVVPDLLLVSKGLSGGMIPVGALVVRRQLFEQVLGRRGAFVHGSTFGENAFGMAAGLATIATIESEGLVANAAARGAELAEGLKALQRKFPMIEGISGRGLLMGIALRAPPGFSGGVLGRMVETRGLLGHLFMVQLMDRFKILAAAPARNNVLRLHPPLCVGHTEVTRLLEALDALLASAHRFPEGVGRGLLAQLIRMARAG
jgi:ornithine--oxo-acid transaminase